jgi:hypothetical protein
MMQAVASFAPARKQEYFVKKCSELGAPIQKASSGYLHTPSKPAIPGERKLLTLKKDRPM